MAKKAKTTGSNSSLKGRKSQPSIPETPEPVPEVETAAQALDNVEELPVDEAAAQLSPAESIVVVEAPPKPRNPSALNLLSSQIVSAYEGEVQDGVNGSFIGHGAASFVNDNNYKGDFHEGCMHGHGNFFFGKTGTKYTGDFFLNKITGKGKVEYRNGAVYEGILLNGQRHGDGIMHAANGASYTGQWRYGKRHGTGSAIYPDGSRYNGNWLNDRRNGSGIQEYPNGDNYVGDWLDDKQHGTGTMRWKSQIYFGTWKEGVPCGKGTYTWIQTTHLDGVPIDARTASADTIERCLNNQYVGDFVNGHRHGSGRFFYSSGAVYNGDWVKDKKHGEGKYVFKSGRTFTGVFEDDHMLIEDETSLNAGRMVLRKTPDGVGASRPQTAHDDPPVTPLAEAPGFTLDLHILLDYLPTPEIKHSVSQDIVNLFIDNLSAMKRIYSNYANIGADSSSSNAILTRLQYWQLLVDLREHISVPIPALDRFVGVNRPVSTVYGADEQFLFREFLTSICIVGKFLEGGKYDTTQAISKMLGVIKVLDSNSALPRPFFKLNFHRHLDELSNLYHKLSITAPKNKQVTAKILLVFLKAIGIINDGTRRVEQPSEDDSPSDDQDTQPSLSRASTQNADMKSKKSSTPSEPRSEAASEAKNEEKLEEQATSPEPKSADTAEAPKPLKTQTVLKILARIDPHIVVASSSSESDSDAAPIYRLDREFCLLDVCIILIELAEQIFHDVQSATERRPSTASQGDANGALFEAIEKENTANSLRASLDLGNREQATWNWVKENIIAAADLYNVSLQVKNG